jgi:hypothetical protein
MQVVNSTPVLDKAERWREREAARWGSDLWIASRRLPGPISALRFLRCLLQNNVRSTGMDKANPTDWVRGGHLTCTAGRREADRRGWPAWCLGVGIVNHGRSGLDATYLSAACHQRRGTRGTLEAPSTVEDANNGYVHRIRISSSHIFARRSSAMLWTVCLTCRSTTKMSAWMPPRPDGRSMNGFILWISWRIADCLVSPKPILCAHRQLAQ